MKCAICGREFEPSKHNRNSQKYCSRECYKNAQSQISKQRYREKRPVAKSYNIEKQTYGGARPMTPALKHFFIRFAQLL